MREHLLEIAKRRQVIHKGQSSQTWMVNDPVMGEYRGLVGEEDYGKIICRKPNLTELPGGDDGADFREVPYLLAGGWTFLLDVEVRTILPHHKLLLHRAGSGGSANVIVVMEFLVDDAVPVGWSWIHDVELIKPTQKPRYVLNHCMPRDWLIPMELLKPAHTAQ